MHTAVVIAASAANRWLIAFTVSVAVVLVLGVLARRAAQGRSSRSSSSEGSHSGIRRRAGAAVAVGPLVGLLVAPDLLHVPKLVVVAALGAAALAAVGWFAERSEDADRITFVATVVAALVAVVAGARFGPTGVWLFDVLGAFALVLVVTQAADGLGNVDSLATSIGAGVAFGVFAPAAFGTQDALASVFAGLVGACFAFLAFNLRPASLFIGRSGRLAIGFAISVGALALRPVAGDAWRDLAVPLILLGVLLLDALIVIGYRLRHQRALVHKRRDHIVHRLVALGWSSGEAVTLMVVAQVVLAFVALFTARAVMPVWLGAGLAVLVLLVLGIEAGRANLERDRAPGLKRGVKIGVAVVIVALVAAVAPAAMAAKDASDLMQQGKNAATRALNAARDGDTITAQGAFNEAAREFGAAADKLNSPTVTPSLGVPFLASNVRAARTLADIGTELANTGESLTVAINPESLEVTGGRLPLEEVAKVQPKLAEGSAALDDALARVRDVSDDPYLASPVRDAVVKIEKQLARAAREAKHANQSATLANAIFGGDGPRHYLLIITNPAESRATGGFTGSYAVMTAVDGKLTVGEIIRTNVWNETLTALPEITWNAPLDYKRRYSPFHPETTLQNVNLSPDFPSVTEVLLSLAPQAGVGVVDGVMSVDPAGLAALLRLTGPVDIADWPEQINADNVVNVTLRDAYARYPDDTGDRVNLLSEVAHAAVDRATSRSLGKPSQIAKELGKAAHEGHIILGFARPAEEALAIELGVAMNFDKAPVDSIALTTSNAGGNKIDYYVQRDVDYRVTLTPDSKAKQAIAKASFASTIINDAPTTGLPQIVIGPFDKRFVAGESRNFVSVYSPLQFKDAGIDGNFTTVAPNREQGHNVVSFYADVFSKSSKTITANLEGLFELQDGWYSLRIRHQPTLNPDRVHVSVDVPDGWRIDKAPGMEIPFGGRATVSFLQSKDAVYRVHIVRDTGTWDLWQRLQDGR
ncbi:MAG: DUF4012 domain-containing protein [Acidimicrobiia bacterium]